METDYLDASPPQELLLIFVTSSEQTLLRDLPKDDLSESKEPCVRPAHSENCVAAAIVDEIHSRALFHLR